MSEDLIPRTKFDITKPLWDQSTFYGRFRHFAFVSNPLLCFAREKELLEAKETYNKIKSAGQLPKDVTPYQALRSKQLYESAFHPDTGELQNVFGRMSFQLPGGCVITGAMLQFYRTNTAIIFWQWINQSFNALVNYTNRNAASPLTTQQMGIAYVSATSAALVTALTFKFVVQKRATNPVVARFVPFVAVAAANCVNIPLMRMNEIMHGIEVTDKDGKVVGKSKIAPIAGISQVVTSRITMAAPGMLILPFIMERLEKGRWMRANKWAHVWIQTAFIGVFLTVMVPTACALFPQRASVSMDVLKRFDPEAYLQIQQNTKKAPIDNVYFNKGL